MARLPAGYQELTHIESTGTQWIDTLYSPKTTTAIRADMAVTTTATNTEMFFGCKQSSGNNYYQFWRASSTVIQVAFGQSTISTSTDLTISLAVNRFYNFFLKNGEIAIDDTKYDIRSAAVNCTVSLGIFARNNPDGVWTSPIKARCSHFSIEDGDVLVRDFIPCRRLSDGAIGMFDLVSQSFFGNSGTGSFIAGAPIIEPTWGGGLASVTQKELLARRAITLRRLYLYKDGDECVGVTGGWVTTNIRLGDMTWNNRKYPTLTKNERDMFTGMQQNAGAGSIWTNKAINARYVRNLVIDYSANGLASPGINNWVQVFFAKDRTDLVKAEYSKTFQNTINGNVSFDGIASIPINSCFSEFFVGFQFSTDAPIKKWLTMHIRKIWLE